MKKVTGWLMLISLLLGTGVLAQAPTLLQNVQGRERSSLDGTWKVIIDPFENGYYDYRYRPRGDGYFKNEKPESPAALIEYDFDTDRSLVVPGDWNTQTDSLYYYEGTVWYKKHFDFQRKEGQRQFLYFEAIHNQARVYLNGAFIGEHYGGFTPFQFEVTNRLEDGDNFVVIKVDSKRRRDGVPTMNMDWWNYGGITRSVHLVSTPDIYIGDYTLNLGQDRNSIAGKIQLGSKSPGQQLTLEIPELNIRMQWKTDQNGQVSFEIPASPVLWSPDHPKRYEVFLSCNGERIKDEIGFRTIEVKGKDILLNGKPVFLRGISIHEEAPFKTGRVTRIEEVRQLLAWASELGCNYIRLAHYPHSEMMVREAERMGMMIWSEIPVYWTIQFSNPETYQMAEQQLEEMISRDRNRAAVILWSVANETPISPERNDFLNKLVSRARTLDNSRLLTAALEIHTDKDGTRLIDDPLGNSLDVVGLNTYCGWYWGKPTDCGNLTWKSVFDKPVVISEVGGAALYGKHGSPEERWTEEYLETLYQHNLKMIEGMGFVRGLSPWILMDFRSPRRHLKQIQNDFNRKGLLSEKGEKKKAFFILQQYYRSKANGNKTYGGKTNE